MGDIRIRTGFRMAAAIATLALPLAVAGNAFATAPGDNGDVKIHQVGAKTAEQDNDPHVCRFYLDASKFDGLQQVSWTISPQAPGAGGTLSGAITLDHGGAGQTGTLSLPDGHYELDWTFVGEHGNGKHKVFWVGCGTPAGGSGGTTGGPTGGSSTSGTPTSGRTGGTTGATSGATSASSTSTPTGASSAHSTAPAPAASSPSMTPTGGLAHTGADGSALIYAAIGAAALAGGGFGLRRYATTRNKG